MKEINLVVMATSPCVFMVVILRHVRPCLKYDGCVCSPKKVVKNLELRVIYPVGMASYKPFTVEFNGLRLDLADLKAPTIARAQFNVTCPASRVDVAPSHCPSRCARSGRFRQPRSQQQPRVQAHRLERPFAKWHALFLCVLDIDFSFTRIVDWRGETGAGKEGKRVATDKKQLMTHNMKIKKK